MVSCSGSDDNAVFKGINSQLHKTYIHITSEYKHIQVLLKGITEVTGVKKQIAATKEAEGADCVFAQHIVVVEGNE